MLKTRDQYKEAASVYFRISGEVMLNLLVINFYKFMHTGLLNSFVLLGSTIFSCHA